MDSLVFDGSLEIRVSGAGRVLRGAFPLGRTATLRSAGRVRKERFASGGGGRSVSWQSREFEKLQKELSETISSTLDDAAKTLKVEALEDAIEKRNTHLLVGHSYDRAIADTKTGNLTLAFSDDAVRFEAALPDDVDQPSWVRDAVLAIRGGQLRGVSPGFQVTTKGAEKLTPDPGHPGIFIRELLDVTVYEYSLVARPAYAGTSLDARQDAAHGKESQGPGVATLWL